MSAAEINEGASAPHASPSTNTPLGLRERRRAELSQAITSATLDLFEKRGVDHTTVGDISAAVGISTRTFFRYFPSKEVAALSGQHAFDEASHELLAVLREDEPLLPQLIAAYRAVTVRLDDSTGDTRRQLVRARLLLLANPGMLAASLQGEEHGNIVFAGMINDRVRLEGGVHEARMAVNMATFALRLAFDEWVTTEQTPGAPSLPTVYDHMIATLASLTSRPFHPER